MIHDSLFKVPPEENLMAQESALREANEITRAQEVWNNIDIVKVRDVSWLAFSDIGKYINDTLAEGRSLHARVFDLLATRPDKENLRGAAMVCGDMRSERDYFLPPDAHFSSVDGFDLSSVSLERAKLNTDFPFTGHCVDVNNIQLPACAYDLVIGSHGIHHILEIRHLFRQIAQSLKAEGIFAFFEWIGPRFLQIPISNRFFSVLLLYILFPLRKHRTTHEGKVKGLLWIQNRPCSFDPSEAINSPEIMPAADEIFQAHTRIFFGGLLYPMFEGLGTSIPNGANKKIQAATRIERFLINTGIIKPLFSMCVYVKKDQQT